MEYFTCWWHPVANVSDSEEVSYTLHYNKEYVCISHGVT